MKILRKLPGAWLAGITAVLGIVTVSALFLTAGGGVVCGSAGCPTTMHAATGDNTHMTLWIILCAVSLLLLLAGIVAAVVIHRKKSKDK